MGAVENDHNSRSVGLRGVAPAGAAEPPTKPTAVPRLCAIMHGKSVVLLLAALSQVAVTDDVITSLPRLTAKPCWKQSAGYLETGTSRKTNLFYWYHEATKDSASKPLILWLNGGPGCSSLGGMFTELGPLVVGMDGNVTFNPFSFNALANVLFLEQPAGVGFSYPNLPANDSTTADDTYHALLAFFKLHPELAGRPFYVMGESCTWPPIERALPVE